MASEVTKVSVVDSRILQSKPKFAVEKGPLSLTNVPYRAITNSQSQMTFNIIVPSESVFIDRAVDWQATVYGSVDMTLTGTGLAGLPIAVYGRDCALAPFPLHQLCATMSATINDTTTVVNTQDVMNSLLRLTDYSKNRKIRTCPNMLDTYQTNPNNVTAVADYADSLMAVRQGVLTNSPLGAFNQEHGPDQKPNGSWGDFVWTDSTGLVATSGDVTTVPAGTTTYSFSASGVPIFKASNVTAASVYRLYFRFKSTERLLISPFIFADDCEVTTGLFGIQNIQLLMNFQSPLGGGRVLRFNNNPFANATNTASLIASNQQFQNVNSGAPFANPVVNIQYLTPSLDVPLPAKNIVPYMDYPRYISQQNIGSITATDFGNNTLGIATATATLNSQTITLPAIPDLLIIYVKPNTYVTSGGAPDPLQGDWVLPITNISVNFDNFAGLLSSHTQEQLYRMSVRNGLEMDFDQWRGYASSSVGGGAITTPVQRVGLSGGPLILKPGRDIVLQAGQAPSLVGNFSLQFQLGVQNQTGSTQTNCQLYVIAVNSGFLETIKGSSRIIKGILTEQDILSAPMGPGSSEAHMGRMVGAGIPEDARVMDGDGRRRGGDRSERREHRRGDRSSGMSSYY
jgi:hypothetical protein|nr:MAG: putative major capsid protein [Lake Baikal virophage 3]